MTTTDVALAVEVIGLAAEEGDHETAHRLEDQAFVEALRAIADGDHQTGEAQALAKEALRSKSISFKRWCS